MEKMTQAQNEALVRLMLAARYQDKRLSLAEEESFNKRLGELSWSSIKDVQAFARSETTSVRKALESEEGLQNFIIQHSQLFQDSPFKTYCLQTIEHILKSDGLDEASKENGFMTKLLAALD